MPCAGEWKIRPLTGSDWQAFLTIQDSYYADDLLRVDHETFLNKIAECPEYVFGAFAQDTLLGYCILKDRPLRPWTSGDFLAVSPDHQSKGAAHQLVQHCFEISKRPFFRIFARPSNHRALRIYDRLGFKKTGIRKNNYIDGEDAVIMMKYVWHLRPSESADTASHDLNELAKV